MWIYGMYGMSAVVQESPPNLSDIAWRGKRFSFQFWKCGRVKMRKRQFPSIWTSFLEGILKWYCSHTLCLVGFAGGVEFMMMGPICLIKCLLSRLFKRVWGWIKCKYYNLIKQHPLYHVIFFPICKFIVRVSVSIDIWFFILLKHKRWSDVLTCPWWLQASVTGLSLYIYVILYKI